MMNLISAITGGLGLGQGRYTKIKLALKRLHDKFGISYSLSTRQLGKVNRYVWCLWGPGLGTEYFGTKELEFYMKGLFKGSELMEEKLKEV